MVLFALPWEIPETMDIEHQAFERDPTLKELLSPTLIQQLQSPLNLLLGPHWHIEDNTGNTLMQGERPPPADSTRTPLQLGIDLLGALISPAPESLRCGAAQLVVRVLAERWRYLISADLHTEVVSADYAELQRRHEELQRSEARYRDLSASLEQRVAEQVALIEHQQRELYHADKLASVGQLAAGVAHEINNPIGFVRSNLSTAQHYTTTFATFAKGLQAFGIDNRHPLWQQHDLDFILQDLRDLMQESQDGIDRVAHIVADLKAFSAVDIEGVAAVDVGDLIRTACRFAQMQLNRPDDSIILNLQPVPAFSCQAAAIGQAILHLVTNALQAIDDQGHATVSVNADTVALTILVEDTGNGIPADIQPRIFDPFFTTRSVGQGKGLGLTVCRDVATAHGGRVEFSSAPGAGSRFALILPIKPDVQE